MNTYTERTAELRNGEARYTVTVTPWSGVEFSTLVRGYSEEQAAARVLAFYCAKTVKVNRTTLTPGAEASALLQEMYNSGVTK
jgi:hypothetical protein